MPTYTVKFNNEEEREYFKRSFPAACDECGYIGEYSDIYDACYCPQCDIWIDSACSDPECNFCASRPKFPSQAKELNKNGQS